MVVYTLKKEATNMNVGERIRGLRNKHNYTQKQLAAKLSIPHQNLSNYERGFRNPDFDTLVKIADFFEVTTDYLLKGSEEQSYRQQAKELMESKETSYAAKGGDPDEEELLKLLEKILRKRSEGK